MYVDLSFKCRRLWNNHWRLFMSLMNAFSSLGKFHINKKEVLITEMSLFSVKFAPRNKELHRIGINVSLMKNSGTISNHDRWWQILPVAWFPSNISWWQSLCDNNSNSFDFTLHAWLCYFCMYIYLNYLTLYYFNLCLQISVFFVFFFI